MRESLISNQLSNQPKAYQDGFQDFYGRDFYVTPDVLIPRPETEQIIDTILTLAGKPFLKGVKPKPRILPKKPIILDVGTGSGCIAITLKLVLKEARIYATDISKKALKIAQKNALKFGVDPTLFIISNLLENVKFTPDVVIANLPYVNENWTWLDKESLSYEPREALFAEDGGLKLIKELISQSKNKKIKYLVLEADPSQHEEITKFAKNNDYKLNDTRGFILTFIKNDGLFGKATKTH